MIEEGNRGVALGMTGSGKSKLLSYYFAMFPGQRLLVDVNDDYELGPVAKEEGACVAREPGAIDWSKRTIRYAPSRLSDEEYDELYKAIWERVCAGHPLLVWLDESEGPTTQNKAPLHMRLALKQGRKKKLTHLAASLRAAEIYGAIITQSEHAWAFKTVDAYDLERIARRFAVSVSDLEAALAQLPEHGFLYHRLGQPVAAFEPLGKDRLTIAARHVRTP